MSGENLEVPPVSWDDIYIETQKLRGMFALKDIPYFPVFELLEKVMAGQLEWIEFLVADRKELPSNYEAFTESTGQYVCFSEQVYESGIKGGGRARFTAAHELGHLCLHTSKITARSGFARQIKPNEKLPTYRLSEPQADQFAAEILMPREFITPACTPSTISQRHGVSLTSAQRRFKFMRSKRLSVPISHSNQGLFGGRQDYKNF